MSREPRTLERPDGSRLYYEVGGRGAPLVLIRGLSRSSAYWFDFRDLLEQHRTVLVLDNRGVGRSSTPRGPWSTEDMADDVADVLRDSGVERADVFGISLGGMVAQHLALRHPHRVKRLMLACTTPGGRGAKRIEPAAALALARSATMPKRRAIRFSAPWVLSAEHLRRSPEIVDRWIAVAEREPHSRRGVLGQLYAAARHEAWSMLHYIEHDTLLLHGDADRLIHPDNSRRLAARIPGARLEWLEGAGHDFPTERPHATRDHVLAFTA